MNYTSKKTIPFSVIVNHINILNQKLDSVKTDLKKSLDNLDSKI